MRHLVPKIGGPFSKPGEETTSSSKQALGRRRGRELEKRETTRSPEQTREPQGYQGELEEARGRG